MGRPTLRLYDGFSHTSPHLKDDVKDLQTLLKGLGYRIRPDGEYGAYTENVVRLFQASKGLGADGVVGPYTWSLLLKKPSPKNPSTTFQTSYSKWDRTLLQQLEELKKYQYTVKKAVKEIENNDLTAIKGLGEKMSEKLKAEGITNFQQLAEMTEKEVDALDEKIKSFAARFRRYEWGKQAKEQ
jgi:predicted flap endonuclease-1-like 5' DNA nuclease